ncbi:MAG TPA: hypothetical protein VGF44_00040 [Terriglobales bacterium]
MRKVCILLLAIIAGFSFSPVSMSGQASTKQAPDPPSWYITDLGTKVVDVEPLSGYLHVQGMWYATSSIEDKQLIAPIVVKISCAKEGNACSEIDATVAMGILKPDITDYVISTWTREHIVAEDKDEGACKITHRLVVDLESKTVTLTDLSSQIDTKECRMFRDANSYILHSGQVMLYPWATYEPLKKK